MALAMVTVTGSLQDAAGNPLNGQVTFTPSTGLTDPVGNPVVASVTDATDSLVIPMSGVTERLNRGKFTVSLVATDSPGLAPAGWAYQVTIQIPGIPDYGGRYLIPSTPNPVDLSALAPA
jgi:hypothetical protein